MRRLVLEPFVSAGLYGRVFIAKQDPTNHSATRNFPLTTDN
jgi:hypothetical protein